MHGACKHIGFITGSGCEGVLSCCGPPRTAELRGLLGCWTAGVRDMSIAPLGCECSPASGCEHCKRPSLCRAITPLQNEWTSAG
eukprot:217902-Chlamydomonas_euryale.AAC.1